MEKSDRKIQVFIKSLDDQKLEYNLEPESTISQFKEQIAQDTSLDVSKIRLIYKARNLNNDKKIQEIVDKDGEVFHLIARIATP